MDFIILESSNIHTTDKKHLHMDVTVTVVEETVFIHIIQQRIVCNNYVNII